MNTKQIIQVIDNKALPDSCYNADFLETSNSWVLRSDHYAFKIRKPQLLTGTDLLIGDRKKMCNKELKLNRMLSEKVYEDVIPVRKIKSNSPGEYESNIVDYALKMKRLDDSQKLLYRLKDRNITDDQVRDIAHVIARFHQKTKSISIKYDPVTYLQKEFDEIKRCDLFVQELLGVHYKSLIYIALGISKKFLNNNRGLIKDRAASGFVHDGHGNLSADNIYLRKHPVIIDRTVTNDRQRKVDVLLDIARLGVDFDYYRMHKLDTVFLSDYLKNTGEKNSSKIKDLYTFYKLYHTNLLITRNVDESTIFRWSEEQKKHLSGLFELLIRYLTVLGK